MGFSSGSVTNKSHIESVSIILLPGIWLSAGTPSSAAATPTKEKSSGINPARSSAGLSIKPKSEIIPPKTEPKININSEPMQ